MSLRELPTGSRGRIRALEGDSRFCARLREMGFGESVIIERLWGTGTLVCQLCGARIALSALAAQAILVDPL